MFDGPCLYYPSENAAEIVAYNVHGPAIGMVLDQSLQTTCYYDFTMEIICCIKVCKLLATMLFDEKNLAT